MHGLSRVGFLHLRTGPRDNEGARSKWSGSAYESLSHSYGKDRSFRRRKDNSSLLYRLHFCEVKSLLKVLYYYFANLISDIFHVSNSCKESLILVFMAVKKDGEILPALI